MSAPEITEVHTVPDHYAVTWAAGTNGNTFRLSNRIGTMTLTLAIRHEGTDFTMPADDFYHVDPSRYGMAHPPRTNLEFLTVARAYVAANY